MNRGNPFAGHHKAHLERDLATFHGVERAHAAYVAALAVARDSADSFAARDTIDDLLDALGDLRTDRISPSIRQVEDAIEQIESRADWRAALSARPRVI